MSDNLVDYNLPMTDAAHSEVRSTVINTYLCPSDPGEPIFLLVAGPTPAPSYSTGFADTDVPKSNYIGVFGTIQMLVACGGGGNCVGNGSVVFQRGFRFADLTDGLSQTFVAGERNSKYSTSTWLAAFAGGMQLPGRIVAVATMPPNSDTNAPFEFQQLPSKRNEFRRGGRVCQVDCRDGRRAGVPRVVYPGGWRRCGRWNIIRS